MSKITAPSTLCFCLFLLFCFPTVSTWGGEGQNSVTTARSSASFEEWRWRRANAAEYSAIVVGSVGAAYLEYGRESPATPKWSSRNDFDEGIRKVLRLGGGDDRKIASTASDQLMGAMIAAPVLDSVVTLGYRDKNWDALWQTSVINLESLTFTSLASVVMQTLVARERPFVRNCVDGRCEFHQNNRSFPSGHAAYAFTGAGLICNHHRYQALYRNDTADSAVCLGSLVAASVDSALRIMADGHYASDVLAGTAIGLFSGFLLPRLLHYDRPVDAEGSKTDAKDGPPPQLIVSPRILPGGAGLTCSYLF